MWGAITKDFGEFVSTVKTETTETLHAIDQNLDQPLNADSGGNDDDTEQKRESLIDPDTGIPIHDDNYDNDDDVDVTTDDDDDEYEGGEESFFEEDWISPDDGPTVEEMRERLISSCEDAFRDELIPKASVTDIEDEIKSPDGSKDEVEDDVATKTIDTESDTGEETEVELFLREFDVGSKTDEITKLLEGNDSIKATFSELATDQALVTYADFWTRYFYRIADDKRLVVTYRIYYDKHLEQQQRYEEEEQQAAADAAASVQRGPAMGLASGVTSFFGGVVDRLTNENTNDHDGTGYGIDDSLDQSADDDDNGDGGEASPGPATRTALGFLSTVTGGGTRRPPFVMNTAVSDSDNAHDDADSEEDLGWDDEDDEDDVEDVDIDGVDDSHHHDDDGETTVEFKDAEKEGLLNDLEQARAERDALQKTVEMQTEELQKKMTSVSTQEESSSSSSAAVVLAASPAAAAASSSSSDAAQRLQMQLFEKDSELAALRARLEDDHNEGDKNDGKNDNNQKQEINNLKELVSSKDHELNELRTLCDQNVTEKENMRAMLQKEIESLQQKLNDAVVQKEQDNQDGDLNRNKKVMQARKETEEIREQFESQILVLQNQIKENNTKQQVTKDQNAASISKLQSELESSLSTNMELQSKLDANEQTLVQLKEELDRCKLSEAKALEEAAEAATAAASGKAGATAAAAISPPLSPGSNSTGVKVPTPDSSDDDDMGKEDARATIVTTPSPRPKTPMTSTSTPFTPATTNAAVSLGLEPSENDLSEKGDGWDDDW